MFEYPYWSPIYIGLTILYFLAASVVTFDIRLTQARRFDGQNFGELPKWTILFYWLQWLVFIALLVLNWQTALILFAIKFVLKVIPVLETIGNILMAPFKPRQEHAEGSLPQPQSVANEDMQRLAIAETSEVTSETSQEELDRRQAIRLLRNVPLAELTPVATATRTGSRIKLNLVGMEILRRVFEQLDIDAGKRRVGENELFPSFLGMKAKKDRLQQAIQKLNVCAGQVLIAESAHAVNTFESLARDIDAAMEFDQGSVVFYVLDSILSPELFHRFVLLDGVDDQSIGSASQGVEYERAYFERQSIPTVDERLSFETSAKDGQDERIKEGLKDAVEKLIEGRKVGESKRSLGIEARHKALGDIMAQAPEILANGSREEQLEALKRAIRERGVENSPTNLS